MEVGESKTTVAVNESEYEKTDKTLIIINIKIIIVINGDRYKPLRRGSRESESTRHIIELSRESGAVALLFCILFRRTVCRYILREISRFKLCASTIVHLTVAAAATTTATSMVLNGNISLARE